MKVKDYIKFQLPSTCKNENVKHICTLVANFAKEYGLTEYESQEIQEGVKEAISNAIEYAYPNSEGVINICCRCLEDNTLEVIIKDKGIGIENLELATSPLFTTGGDTHSGMGFTVMDAFMDKMKVISVPGKGTTVRLRKSINIK